jgi:hypothetical protein
MSAKIRPLAVSIVAVNALLCGALHAGTDSASVVATEVLRDPEFQHGRWEAQTLSGAVFSPVDLGPSRTVLNFAYGEGRLGYMLGSPGRPSWYRGNFELLGGV